MKILVTGGAGFIASQVAQAYIEAGHQVTVLDNLSTGKRENLPPQAEFVQADIASPQAARVVADGGFSVVNHHAAQISVPASVADPVHDAQSNVLGLLNLLEAGRKAGLERFIFVSSGGAVYGELEGAPVDESFPARPMSPYAVAKRAGELYLDYYTALHGLGTVVLRYANVYGPRQIPHAEAGVVAIFMDCLVNGSEPTIYRPEDMPGGMKRDYTFVGDIVRANLAALERGQGIYNIGTGRGHRYPGAVAGGKAGGGQRHAPLLRPGAGRGHPLQRPGLRQGGGWPGVGRLRATWPMGWRKPGLGEPANRKGADHGHGQT